MCCINIDKEIALVGLLNYLTRKAPNKTIEIVPKNVISFCNWLSNADCGPIIKIFTLDDIEKLMDSKMKKTSNEKYTIENLNTKELIEKFEPDLNYPATFLKFMKLID